MREALTIQGEPQLTRRLREAAGRDALGHALIFSGRGDLAGAARFAAAAMECQGGDRPCGLCPPCRKVLRGVHPDVTAVEDLHHKSISVEVLRGVVADAWVLPNEGRRKIYLFPDCGLLEPRAQNVLLKVLEDGPPHAAFLLCAANSAVLLPTIRSRAEEWRLSPPQEADGADPRARRLCELLCRRQPADVAAFCAQLESGKLGREELRALLSDARDLTAAGLAAACGAGGDELSCRLAAALGGPELSAAAEIFDAHIRMCAYNIGVGHVTGALAVALTGVSEQPPGRRR